MTMPERGRGVQAGRADSKLRPAAFELKMSGIGRELGPWGAEEYLQVKQVYINLNEQPIGWY